MDTLEIQEELKDTQERLKRVEDILYGISDDVRFKEVVRSNIITGEHATNKPTIIDRKGKRYKIQTV